MWQIASTGEKIMLILTALAYLAGMVWAFFYWINKRHRRVLGAVEEIRSLIVEQEKARVKAKCDSLFTRVLRELRKLPDFIFHYERHSDTIMFVTAHDVTMTIAVDPHTAGYNTGQLIGCGLPMGAIHSCENQFDTFAKQIQWALRSVRNNEYDYKTYLERKAESERYAAEQAAKKAEAEKPKPPRWWQKDVLHIVRTRTAAV